MEIASFFVRINDEFLTHVKVILKTHGILNVKIDDQITRQTWNVNPPFSAVSSLRSRAFFACDPASRIPRGTNHFRAANRYLHASSDKKW